MDTLPEAVVVGAGLAGLAAALELHDARVAVTVLEARDRVGGRVWSVTLGNGEVAEMGAEWILPGNDELVALCERLGVALAPTGTDYRRRTPWGAMASTLEEQDAFLAAAEEARGHLGESDAAAMTLEEFVNRVPGSDRQRATFRSRLLGTCAIELDRVALRVADGERAFRPERAAYYRAARGNQAIAEALAGRLPDVRLGCRVSEVEHDSAGVTVRWAGAGAGELRSGVAVVAVPAPLVPEIRFRPALPDALAEAVSGLPTGVASKLAVATLKEPSLRSIQNADLPFWCWAASGRDGRPRRVLTSFAGSSLAQRELRTAEGDPGPWLERLEAMNPDLSFEGEPVMHAWGQDPLTLGGYSALDNASFDRFGVLQETVGRLAFAGEHTAGPLHHATMEGAVRSGRRAAAQVGAMFA